MQMCNAGYYKMIEKNNMRKNVLILKLILITILGMVNFCSSEIKWAPYYAFNLSEGVYIPSVGKWGITTNLTNDLGFIVKPSQKHSILLFYELKYLGPGLKRQEGEKFEQRNMGHLLMAQHSFKFNKDITFKTRLSYVTDWWRSGTNELWGYGLYDSLRYGINEDVEWKIEKLTLIGQVGYSQIKFPNYTNLIEEFQSGSEETTAGKQDNNLLQLGVKSKYEGHVLGLSFINQAYLNQKILTETGTYSSDIKQNDLSLELYYNKEVLKIVGPLWTSPYFSFKYKDSNQGYLHFKSITEPPTFVSNFYDYTKILFSFPVNLNITKTKYISFVPDYEITNYTRERRDENNNFVVGEKHYTNLAILSFAYISNPDENRKVTLFYTLQTQSSSTKFEKYFPYNYTGNYLGISYSYSF